MSEPKKETVRIVLPPRRDGQPAASGPRETAMINLPPKPVPKPADPASAGLGPCNFRRSQTPKFTVSGAESPAERRIFVPPGGAEAAFDCGRGAQTARVARGPEAAFRHWRTKAAGRVAASVCPPLCAKGALGFNCAFRGARVRRGQEGDREGSSERGDYAAEFAPSVSPSAKKARLFDVKFRDNGCAAGSKRRRRRIDGRNSRLGGFSRRGWRAGLDVPLAFGWKHPEGGHARISRGYGFSFDLRLFSLMASENIVELNDSNFDNEVSKISEPLLVDFWAPWCAPCRMLDPVVGEIAKENAGKFAIAKVNVDESPGVSESLEFAASQRCSFSRREKNGIRPSASSGKAEIVRRLQALG